MAFKDTFCPSPWFHMRINNSGTYEPCRWMTSNGLSRFDPDRNIRTQSPLTYFQQGMSGIRTQLLQGASPAICTDCVQMERHHKVSGRQRQLLKVGVRDEYFEKSLAGSPSRSAFDYSQAHDGHTLAAVRDWQIDLGNYCNGACVYCNPESSSRLATEFVKLGLIDQAPAASWCDDPDLVERFVADLRLSPNLEYLHFIGGETLITPGFRRILQALVDADIAPQVAIGFTTNLAVWSDAVVDLLRKFKTVNLGMSIESLNSINDYVRYPSCIDQVRQTLDRWVALAQSLDWLIQLRITPTCLTVHDLASVYQYAWQNNLAVESCNFLDKPEFFRISVLPAEQRNQARLLLQDWIDQHHAQAQEQIINTRDPNRAHDQILQDAASYVNYLTTAQDESDRLPDLIEYLRRLEANRGNTILTYLPQYELLFRSAGY